MAHCYHEIGRESVGGIPGHEHVHATGPQICIKCKKTLDEICTERTERYLRSLFLFGHGCDTNCFYLGDGEMSCNKCKVDYLRAPLPQLIKSFAEHYVGECRSDGEKNLATLIENVRFAKQKFTTTSANLIPEIVRLTKEFRCIAKRRGTKNEDWNNVIKAEMEAESKQGEAEIEVKKAEVEARKAFEDMLGEPLRSLKNNLWLKHAGLDFDL